MSNLNRDEMLEIMSTANLADNDTLETYERHINDIALAGVSTDKKELSDVMKRFIAEMTEVIEFADFFDKSRQKKALAKVAKLKKYVLS